MRQTRRRQAVEHAARERFMVAVWRNEGTRVEWPVADKPVEWVAGRELLVGLRHRELWTPGDGRPFTATGYRWKVKWASAAIVDVAIPTEFRAVQDTLLLGFSLAQPKPERDAWKENGGILEWVVTRAVLELIEARRIVP